MSNSRPRTWANAHHREWQQKKRRYKRKTQLTSYGVYAAAIALFVAVFAAVFYWPSKPAVNQLASSQPFGDFTCNVLSITDGDTLRCWDGTRIRLHAVAARESDETCSPGHPCPSASGASATAKLSELASGQKLQCLKTGTSYKRVTAICRNEASVEINCAMIQSGTTVIWPKYNQQQSICRG